MRPAPTKVLESLKKHHSVSDKAMKSCSSMKFPVLGVFLPQACPNMMLDDNALRHTLCMAFIELTVARRFYR
jgi:hypothetical protein